MILNCFLYLIIWEVHFALAWSLLLKPLKSLFFLDLITTTTLNHHHDLVPNHKPKPQPHGKSYTIPILFSFKIPRTPRQDLTTATFKPPLSCHHYFMSSHPHTSFILFSLLCHPVLYSNSRIKLNKTLHFVEIRFAHIWALWESKSTLGGAVSVLAIPIR